MSERVAMALAILVGGTAWGALAYLVLVESPEGWALVAFFPALALALAGTAAPIVRLLHNHFILRKRRPGPAAALRQGLWVGLFITLCAAMQLARQLDVALVLGLGVVFMLLEGLLQRRV
ncbi:MAG: hypothetical protein IT330_02925 [Anaerolineae bacterium]|nr:hypothetical protein [Anaerolineae bacterium]